MTTEMPPTDFDLDHFLPYRLDRLADRVSEALAQLYETHYGLNVAQWRVLAWLHHRHELTAKQIRAATRMDKARVSRAVQVLEGRGLIVRRPSPRDQRLHDLRLTETGQALMVELVPQVRAWEAELVAPLTTEEYHRLLDMMARLERQLRDDAR
ncbi:MarR family winged helix-turn-helix transcriptional regulator [Halomonas caseinilytica]|uniref:MarR family winged helix-turn-helix transcriptional regulator n=1 Tax=Halomonas caseinilytica TaxID=438744 RepID=UPI0007E5917F|nr:MarR family winged helix-turn-helix transcriptional regulator [Halomonas caseinilytica]SEM81267.1 DNA-binding transcriptional regulator, MarR family [Halomonas caseinilytica]